MSDFLSMGGYARFVWPSYALFLVMLLGSWGTAVWRSRQIRRDIRKMTERETT